MNESVKEEESDSINSLRDCISPPRTTKNMDDSQGYIHDPTTFHRIEVTNTTTISRTTSIVSNRSQPLYPYVMNNPTSQGSSMNTTRVMTMSYRQQSTSSYGPPSTTDYAKCLQERESITKAFRLKFEPHKALKNPQYVYNESNETLFSVPSKALCIFLGDRIVKPSDDVFLVVYLKFADATNKNRSVEPCSKHPGNPFANMAIQSLDSGVVITQVDPNTKGLVFHYPFNSDSPSISVFFPCSSSCFQRAMFVLHVDLWMGRTFIAGRQCSLKVSSNPARDASVLTNKAQLCFRKLAAIDSAFKPQKRSRCSTVCTMDGNDAKRASVEYTTEFPEDDENDSQVYTLHVFGRENYKQLLHQGYLLIRDQKYENLRNHGSEGLKTSQIESSESIQHWLESMAMVGYKDILIRQGCSTMSHIMDQYHKNFFEDIGIKREDAQLLHQSFITWQTVYLHKHIQ